MPEHIRRRFRLINDDPLFRRVREVGRRFGLRVAESLGWLRPFGLRRPIR